MVWLSVRVEIYLLSVCTICMMAALRVLHMFCARSQTIDAMRSKNTKRTGQLGQCGASVASRHVSKWWAVLKMRCVINSSIAHICLKCHCCCTVLIIIVKAAGKSSAAP